MEKKILNFATNRGYIANHVEKVSEYEGENIYVLSLIDTDGMAMPIGLPVIVIEKDSKFRIIEGDDTLLFLDKIK